MQVPPLVGPLEDSLTGHFQTGSLGSQRCRRGGQHLNLESRHVCLIRHPNPVKARSAYSNCCYLLRSRPVQRLDAGRGCCSSLPIRGYPKPVLARGQNTERRSDRDLALWAHGRHHLSVDRHRCPPCWGGESGLSRSRPQQQDVSDTDKHVPNRGRGLRSDRGNAETLGTRFRFVAFAQHPLSVGQQNYNRVRRTFHVRGDQTAWRDRLP